MKPSFSSRLSWSDQRLESSEPLSVHHVAVALQEAARGLWLVLLGWLDVSLGSWLTLGSSVSESLLSSSWACYLCFWAALMHLQVFHRLRSWCFRNLQEFHSPEPDHSI